VELLLVLIIGAAVGWSVTYLLRGGEYGWLKFLLAILAAAFVGGMLLGLLGIEWDDKLTAIGSILIGVVVLLVVGVKLKRR